MFFNYDSVPLIVTTIIIGGMFTFTIYSIFTTSGLQTPTHNEVGVQTESLVNTIQPNIDSISELPETVFPVLQPNVLPDNLHVDVGVQTSTKSLYAMFKEWLREFCNMNSSDIGKTPTDVRVENWIDNLSANQLVSTNSMNSVVSQGLVNVNDSTSNVVESIVPQLIDPTQIPLPVSDVSSVVTNAVITTGPQLVDRAQILAELALNNPLNTTDLSVLSVWAGI